MRIAFTVAVHSRSSKRRRVSPVTSVGNSTRASPCSAVTVTGKPDSWKTPSMGRLCASTSALNVFTPRAAAICASCPSRMVPSPCPWYSSLTTSATSARSPPSPANIAWPMMRPALPTVATSPTASPEASTMRLASRGSAPSDTPPQKRSARDCGERARRKSPTRPSSPGSVARTCTVEPSRSTTSHGAGAEGGSPFGSDQCGGMR